MFTVKIVTLLEQRLGPSGSDVQLTAIETAPGVWSAYMEGDTKNAGTGASPHLAIGDYTAKVAGKSIDVASPGADGGLVVALAADASDATIEVKNAPEVP